MIGFPTFRLSSSRIWAVLFGFLCMLALEIHQLSWMTITLLRQSYRQMFCHLLFQTLSFLQQILLPGSPPQQRVCLHHPPFPPPPPLALPGVGPAAPPPPPVLRSHCAHAQSERVAPEELDTKHAKFRQANHTLLSASSGQSAR